MARGHPLPLVLVCLAIAVGCGDDGPAGAQQAARCDDVGAWSIANVGDASSGGVIGRFGDRVVGWSDPPGELRRLHLASTCGEGQIDLVLEGDLEGNGTSVIVGDELVVQGEDAAVRVDPQTGATHKLFDAVFDTMLPTPQGGVLALGIGGKLQVHNDPANPDAEPVLLLDGAAWLPRPDVDVPPPWPHLWSDGSQTFGLSVDFELMRVPLSGAEPQIELPEVQEFHVLDGGRAVAWRGLDGDVLTVTNLDNDSEIFSSPQNNPQWDAQEAGRWALIITDQGRLVNLDDGNVIEPVDFEPMKIVATNTDNALLVGTAKGSVAMGYWLLGPDGQLSNLIGPDGCAEFDSKVTPGGVVIPEGECDPVNTLYNANDVMMMHPYDGGAPIELGERESFTFSVVDDRWIVSWDEDGGSGLGELSGDAPDSGRTPMANNVTIADVVVDGLDVFYFQDGRGVERYRLP